MPEPRANPTSAAPNSEARSPTPPLVLILGAGINGVAIARELLLNHVSVLLVDTADTCFGASAYSSRLIHGGLRYLEYGEFDLVRESLEERDRLLRLAGEFVRPLELFIPTSSRLGGLLGSIGRFFRWRWWPGQGSGQRRGLWLVRMGLELYDMLAKDRLPKHRVLASLEHDAVPVDPCKYSHECAYYDAQLQFPERFVMAMLHDARLIAQQNGCEFRLLNYHEARRDGGATLVEPISGSAAETITINPAAIINATGAWVDRTLERLPQPSQRLIGGTKGSHLFTFHPGLRELLRGRGVYVEADDGRPIFILPLAGGVLIGTTDKPFDAPPETAVAEGPEVDYLLAAVDDVFPQAKFHRNDIAFHYCGVRPLPYVDHTKTAAITRRHSLHRHEDFFLPLFSIIGGKLTTCRSLADETAKLVLAAINRPHVADSKARVLPGNESQPAQLSVDWSRLAQQHGLTHESVSNVWSLVGTETPTILAAGDRSDTALLPDLQLPERFVRWSIQNEWVVTLDDLVERRLMLLYHQRLTTACLHRLAELLVEAGRLKASQIDAAVQNTIARLQNHFGKRVDSA